MTTVKQIYAHSIKTLSVLASLNNCPATNDGTCVRERRMFDIRRKQTLLIATTAVALLLLAAAPVDVGTVNSKNQTHWLRRCVPVRRYQRYRTPCWLLLVVFPPVRG